jgi:beta-xylosidase
MEIEEDTKGGLVLFYDEKGHSGILADNKNIFANLRGWQLKTDEDVINHHVFLRLVNIENTVDMYYSTNNKEWNKIESSLEVTSFNHNALNGFLSLRIGLCAIGEGSVRFKNFEYTAINK